MPRCPVCKREVAPRSQNASFPFCSDRCALIDLGRWLGGDYRIAVRPEENEDEEQASAAAAGEEGADDGEQPP
jgi:endogenous inhibitor of DNA gyrase (YacG/DUF329 family)